MTNPIALAYSARAAEYIDLLGTMSAVHSSDRQLVASWAELIEGDVIDAGCGPGQWTDFLRRCGANARGIDQVAEFVDSAREHYPDSEFQQGSLEALNADSESVGGVLAWYSLIHHEPRAIHVPLGEFHRALRPGGELLIGFFEGPTLEQFDHAVAPAYRWPVSVLSEELDAAGFDIIETHTRTTLTQRPHAAIHARRSGRPLLASTQVEAVPKHAAS